MVVANMRMRERLNQGRAIDVSKCARYGGAYILPPGMFVEGKDYCNARTEEWIWSIGRRKLDGQILASHSDEFYQNDNFECLMAQVMGASLVKECDSNAPLLASDHAGC